MMAGGGSLLKGMDKLISSCTDIPVYVSEDPLLSVAQGIGIVLENIEVLRKVLITIQKN